jgi:hypothetical protein
MEKRVGSPRNGPVATLFGLIEMLEEEKALVNRLPAPIQRGRGKRVRKNQNALLIVIICYKLMLSDITSPMGERGWDGKA